MKGLDAALLAALQRASDGDFDDEGGDPERRHRKLLVLVGVLAGSLIMLELLLAKTYTFFLGNVSAFIAIPIAMFGLSLGALFLHWSSGRITPRRLLPLLPLLFLATLLSFLLFFLLFNQVFNLTHHRQQNPMADAAKIVSLSLVFVPVFALGGVVLSVAFRSAADRVGLLYASDLAGAALACVVTPLTLHFFGLPVAICLVLAAQLSAFVYVFSRYRYAVALVAAVLIVLLVTLAARQLLFVEVPDPQVLGVRYSRGHQVIEHRHRWNEVSRVALLEWRKPGRESSWRVLHDDGISNVHLYNYDPVRAENPPYSHLSQSLPFLLDRRPRSALVMFAGAGQDMIRLYEQAGGALEVTGVEINELVPWIVTTPPYDRWNLRGFFELPAVSLEIDEGRAFLERSRRRYDLIFVATNGAQATRTGHLRKFLDTYEATAAYLDHLAEGGLLVFNHQPFRFKLEILKRLFEERDLEPLASSAIWIGTRSRPRLDSTDILLVKPDGFSPGEVARIRGRWESAPNHYTHHAPGLPWERSVAGLIQSPPDRAAFVPTDDRPYERPVSFAEFELFPEVSRFSGLAYSLDWMKVFTLVFFGALSLLTVGAFCARKRGPRRLPVWLLLYFLATGVCYMLAEIGLMAKLELFLGKPLYSIAVVLAAFLLANGAGSAFVGRLRALGRPLSPLVPALASVLAVPMTLVLIDRGLILTLGLPLAIKGVLAAVSLAPLAFVLGMFYPLGVGIAVERGCVALVPLTFGLTTLSSVVGSTYAMVMIINVGFSNIILQAGLGYVAISVLLVLSIRRRAER